MAKNPRGEWLNFSWVHCRVLNALPRRRRRSRREKKEDEEEEEGEEEQKEWTTAQKMSEVMLEQQNETQSDCWLWLLAFRLVLWKYCGCLLGSEWGCHHLHTALRESHDPSVVTSLEPVNLLCGRRRRNLASKAAKFDDPCGKGKPHTKAVSEKFIWLKFLYRDYKTGTVEAFFIMNCGAQEEREKTDSRNMRITFDLSKKHVRKL